MWTATIAGSFVTFEVVRRRLGERAARGATVVFVALRFDPILAVVGLISWLATTRWRRRDVAPPGDLQAMAGALVVGTAAGLSLQSSLERAGAALGPDRTGELNDVLREARHLGLGAALARSDGSMSPLLRRLARAQVSGAPLLATITGFAVEERGNRRAARVEAARKLPVRLTIPLALLVLPGFVLLTAGPAAVGSLQRMLGPLLP